MSKFFSCLMTSICLTFCAVNASQITPSHQSPESNTEKAREHLLLHLSGEWVSRALYVVTKLEIADYLQDGPKSLQEIAAFSQANPESLQRILHMLAGFGIFEEQDGAIFANNETSALLTKTNPNSLHHLSTFMEKTFSPHGIKF